MFTCSKILQAGMPHLDIFGLSELFCLANAGDNHWSLISKLTSRMPSEWKGDQGERIYASFVYASVTYHRHFSVEEDDTIRIECVPRSLLAPFFITETNYIKADSDIVATVRLMSTFSSTNGHSNNKFLRSTIDFHSDPFGETILESTKSRYKEMYRHNDGDLKKTQEHVVNPSVDFNAAKFMYFVNYCQLFKRYESPELSSTVPLKFREIAYFGNVDPFERVTIFSRQKNMNVMSAMNRSSDQKCIARSFSVSLQDQGEIPDVDAGIFGNVQETAGSCNALR
ncbi:LnmK family bifunctional acyltransferase/decarboxylase [Hoeflea sp. TYP-13]|uniref:LnmK family bifunctional acyltransferase/decarboxylase n=1 Tax=Hoeflea sp. TYP-13 TaxID=3230023 RepID=UPI0034C65E9F